MCLYLRSIALLLYHCHHASMTCDSLISPQHCVGQSTTSPESWQDYRCHTAERSTSLGSSRSGTGGFPGAPCWQTSMQTRQYRCTEQGPTGESGVWGHMGHQAGDELLLWASHGLGGRAASGGFRGSMPLFGLALKLLNHYRVVAPHMVCLGTCSEFQGLKTKFYWIYEPPGMLSIYILYLISIYIFDLFFNSVHSNLKCNIMVTPSIYSTLQYLTTSKDPLTWHLWLLHCYSCLVIKLEALIGFFHSL